MRSERLMVIGSSMLGTTWTTITFASSTRDLEDWLTLSTYKRIRQNSINIVPYSGPTPGDPKMVLLRNRLRSEEHTSELQSHSDLVCRLLLEKKNQSP